MNSKGALSDYIQCAMQQAKYEDFEDGTFGATIPPCIGVFAFGDTMKECETELRSVLEDWILVGLRLGDELPVVGGIDLNLEVELEPVDAY